MAEGVVIVTGGSRGIGEKIAIESAKAGNDVVIGYVDPNKQNRAEGVVSVIESLGRAALAIRADLTDAIQSRAMLASAREFAQDQRREITALVLNAAGGLEKESTPSKADLINTKAPWLLASNFLIAERNAGTDNVQKTVVYVTSNPSHFYGHPQNLMPSGEYDIVASSKNQGEQILRNDLTSQIFGIELRLLVTTADLVDGTGGSILLRRAYRNSKGNRHVDLFADRNKQLEPLIGRGLADAAEFGAAIVGLFMNDELPSGHTLYVPKPVLGEYVVPASELPFGLGQNQSMYSFLR